MALASGVAMRVVHGERRRAVHLCVWGSLLRDVDDRHGDLWGGLGCRRNPRSGAGQGSFDRHPGDCCRTCALQCLLRDGVVGLWSFRW